MMRPRTLLSLSLVFGVSTLAAAGCKKGEKTEPEAQTKPTEVVPPEPVELPPLAGDLPLINKTLEALGEATLAKALQEGDAGGLPVLDGEVGFACGSDTYVGKALEHIGFDPAPLKEEKGFRFINVCVGWRPFIKPYTEMFWMISAGETNPETGVMAHRRCIRVHATEDGFAKAAIIDGLCLELHVQSRARAMAEGDEDGAEAVEEDSKHSGAGEAEEEHGTATHEDDGDGTD